MIDVYIVSNLQLLLRILLWTTLFAKLFLYLKLFFKASIPEVELMAKGHEYFEVIDIYCQTAFQKQFSCRNLHPHLLGNFSLSLKILFITTKQKSNNLMSNYIVILICISLITRDIAQFVRRFISLSHEGKKIKLQKKSGRNWCKYLSYLWMRELWLIAMWIYKNVKFVV